MEYKPTGLTLKDFEHMLETIQSKRPRTPEWYFGKSWLEAFVKEMGVDLFLFGVANGSIVPMGDDALDYIKQLDPDNLYKTY